MTRDVGFVCRFSSSPFPFLSFSACGQQELKERTHYELQIGLYVRIGRTHRG